MLFHQPNHLFIPQYEFAYSNQHGSRYRETGGIDVPVIRVQINACSTDARGWELLSLLSYYLEEPLVYKTERDNNRVYIELCAANDVRKLR